MKKAIKILAVLFSAFIVLVCCSCKAKDEVSLASSTSETTKDSRTLLLAMTASNNLDNIGGIRIVTASCTIGAPVINDKTDMEFLQHYTYSDSRTTKKGLEAQLLKDKTNYSFEVVTENQSKYFLYLMQDGSIAIQQMCGDSEVYEISYDFYTADKEYVLTKDKLESLISKEQ